MMTFALLCEVHGVCRAGFRKKACLPSCVILRSDRCQAHVMAPYGWGFHQCSRKPLGNGLCRQHRGQEDGPYLGPHWIEPRPQRRHV